MISQIIPKLPFTNKKKTKDYYSDLGFDFVADYDHYLIATYNNSELHFFEFKELNPKENYGQVYIRTDNIEKLYKSLLDNGTSIHPNGILQTKPWGQKEFSLLDPDNNLLTFGQES